MKKNIFNFKLYLDSLKQLRLTGIILTAISIIISVLPAIINFIQKQQNQLNINYNVQGMTSIIAVTPVLIGIMYIGSLFIVYNAFSFLNKRNSSDFYHSLPNTRLCTYTSIGASALTWLYTIIISTIMVTWLSYLVLGVPLNINFIPYLLMDYIFGTTLVASTALIAVSITGTRVSNFIVTGLVLFLPRFISLLYSVGINNMTKIANTKELGFFFSPDYNFPTALIFNSFSGILRSGNSGDTLFTFVGGIIYTAVLALIYLAIGGILFIKRKSETADKEAPNKVLQHIYRSCISLPLLLVIALKYISSNDKANFFAEEISIIVTMFALSLIVYFVYELITTKKYKNLLKAAPIYLIVVLFTVLFGAGATASGNMILNNTPNASEISAVYINANNQNYNGVDRNEKTYNDILVSKIAYDNTAMKEIISSSLKTTVESVKNRTYVMHQQYRLSFNIKTKNGKTIKRYISFDFDDIEKLAELRLINTQYKNVFRKLPTDEEITSINCYGLDKNTTELLWKTFKEEAATLNDREFLYTNMNNPLMYYESRKEISNPIQEEGVKVPGFSTFWQITITGSVGTENYCSSFSINSHTPKTANLYIKESNKFNIEGTKQYINNILSYKDGIRDESNYYYNFEIYNSSNEKFKNHYQYTFSSNKPFNSEKQMLDTRTLSVEDDKKIFKIIKKSGLKDADVNKPYAKFNVSYFSSIDNDSRKFGSNGSMQVSLSEEEISSLIAISEKTQ